MASFSFSTEILYQSIIKQPVMYSFAGMTAKVKSNQRVRPAAVPFYESLFLYQIPVAKAV
jgi:hypothetical protein